MNIISSAISLLNTRMDRAQGRKIILQLSRKRRGFTYSVFVSSQFAKSLLVTLAWNSIFRSFVSRGKSDRIALSRSSKDNLFSMIREPGERGAEGQMREAARIDNFVAMDVSVPFAPGTFPGLGWTNTYPRIRYFRVNKRRRSIHVGRHVQKLRTTLLLSSLSLSLGSALLRHQRPCGANRKIV